MGHSDNREIVDILLEEDTENMPGMAAGAGGRRRGRQGGAVHHREREFTGELELVKVTRIHATFRH